MTDTKPATKKKMPFPIEWAAMENLTPAFFRILATLRLEVLVVRFQASGDSPIWEHNGIERDLEWDLQSVQAGQFDAGFYITGALYHFFHVNDLAKAMRQLKASLAARGLLEITTLLHAETAHELRVWYPPTAELVTTEDAIEA
jgi:hypothetical protein